MAMDQEQHQMPGKPFDHIELDESTAVGKKGFYGAAKDTEGRWWCLSRNDSAQKGPHPNPLPQGEGIRSR